MNKLLIRHILLHDVVERAVEDTLYVLVAERVEYRLAVAAGVDEPCLLEDAELERVADACRNFRLALLGTEGFDCAQVTAGGIKTGGFNPETLESWFMPRLFVCGELLDVDGDCGGYNLQWAWASGRLVGRLGK